MKNQLKILFIGLITLDLISCSTPECFPKLQYAKEKADKFCSQANGNKTHCESLVFEKNSCHLAKDNQNICQSTNKGIEAFLDLYKLVCHSKGTKETCHIYEQCEWVFPYEASYHANFVDRP